MQNSEPNNIYIFGYGGLIAAESRAMTIGANTPAIPVTLTGFERHWGFNVPSHQLTTLSLRANVATNCVGILFALTSDQLARLDQREQGYERVVLPAQQLHLWPSQAATPNETIYTYLALHEAAPSPECPIVQSDIDNMLAGCLRGFGEPFARAVVQTTSGWHHPYLNDRHNPRYPFSLHQQALWGQIDRLLAEEKVWQ